MHILNKEKIWETEWSGTGVHAVSQHRGAIILGPGYFILGHWTMTSLTDFATVNLWNPALQSHALQ